MDDVQVHLTISKKTVRSMHPVVRMCSIVRAFLNRSSCIYVESFNVRCTKMQQKFFLAPTVRFSFKIDWIMHDRVSSH